jgi:hypothetical protein
MEVSAVPSFPDATIRRPAPAHARPGHRLRVQTTRTSLSLPPALPLKAWQKVGADLHVIADASGWWQGDWLVYGQDRFPDRYQCALQETGLDYQTLRNYAWVARTFPPARRRSGLSFQHHAEVASLTAAEQEQWLSQAEECDWSRNTLRQRLQAQRAGGHSPESREVTLSVTLSTAQQRRKWQQAAECAGSSLSAWISKVLDRTADRILHSPPDDREVAGRRADCPRLEI